MLPTANAKHKFFRFYWGFFYATTIIYNILYTLLMFFFDLSPWGQIAQDQLFFFLAGDHKSNKNRSHM